MHIGVFQFFFEETSTKSIVSVIVTKCNRFCVENIEQNFIQKMIARCRRCNKYYMNAKKITS